MVRLAAVLVLTAAGSALAEPPSALVATGKARTCIPLWRDHRDQALDARTILFSDGQRRGYRSDLSSACPGLGRRNNAITLSTSTSEVCAGDLITVFDPVSHAEFGSCPLGPFTPVVPATGHHF